MLRIVEEPIVGHEQVPSPRDPTRLGPIRGWEGYLHLRCRGKPIFLDQSSLDLALLLDLDPTVREWKCLSPMRVRTSDGKVEHHVAAFRVERNDGTIYRLDVNDLTDRRPVDGEFEYVTASRAGLLDEIAVCNARGIMAHSGTLVPVSDQVRLLSLLDNADAVTLSDAVGVMRSAHDPIGAVMALAARRVVRLDLRSALIGPRTMIERAPSERLPSLAASANVAVGV